MGSIIVFIQSLISRAPRNFEKLVIGAYRWLSENYLPGDRIFLFGQYQFIQLWLYTYSVFSGFSRGAYQVRVLSAMIATVSTSCVCLLCYFS